MTDHQKPKPTTTPTILCRYCGHSIRRRPYPGKQGWIHNWTGKVRCTGKGTDAEPSEETQ